ncbi:MAG: NADH-quinone oxidoreductase subunit NuoH [Acidimicrobiia bacterium]|nr:NADH-quinone oxidoreductase subunit NuoH [Acidimicrobiia bacterium]
MSDLLSNFWILLALKLAAIGALVPVSALIIGTAELKISAHMQSRIGPYFAGGRFGWAQLIADGIKFFQKEDIIPEDADRQVFRWAPALVLLSTVALFVVIPFSPTLIVRDLDLGVFYVLAISSISTIGVLMAGWSSANKYSLMGGLRAAGQLIAYELPLVLAVVGVVIQAGTMSMVGIVEAQASFEVFGTITVPYVAVQFVGFLVFMTAALAELSRIPFDLPVAESELVMGFVTEYTGFRFLFFFLGEYASMFSMSAIAATLFLGGYHFPGLDPAIWGPVVLVVKIFFLAFLMIWFRWTFPRLREDQLQTFAWKWLIPVSLANIAVTGVFKVVF